MSSDAPPLDAPEPRDDYFYEELTRTNNDLTNTQRELARKNAELVREITARREAEASLRLVGSAVDQAQESILITDAEIDLPGPRIIFVNPAFTRMTGYSPEEAIGQTPRMLQGPGTDRAVLRRLRKNLECGEEFFGETINYRKDGTAYHIEWHIAPMRDANGKVTHFVSVQRDISDRKRAEATIAQANKELLELSHRAGMAEIATGVLHNVGNVLNSVNVSADMLSEHISKAPVADLARVVELLREQGENLGAFFTSDPRGPKLAGFLSKLTDNFTLLQEKERGEVALLKKNVEHIREIVAMQQRYAHVSGATEILQVTDLVEDTLRINAASFQRHEVEVKCDFEAALPPLLTVKHKVMQILINLLSNAKQACDSPGHGEKRITVRVSHADDRMRVEVRDNGVGIAAENLDRIFNHGFTTKKDGHGFGLHSAANAAKELGGSLTVQSDGLGLGATFTLELPCPAQKEAA